MTKNDEQVDRLLAAVQRPDGGAASASCLDAETLAAWMDGQLGGPALARAEAHAAACGRCGAMLAAMARTTGAEAGQAAPARSWFRRVLPWAAPLTAAATAAALYVAVRPPAADESLSPRIVQAEPPAAPPAAAEPQPAAPRQDEATQEASLPAPTLSTARRETFTADRELSKPGADAAAVAPPAAAPTPERRPSETDANRTGRAMAGRAGGTARTAEPGSLERYAPPAASKARAALADAVQASPVVIPSGDPSIRWRIVQKRVIERSTDGGSTWAAQHTVQEADLATGSAPTSDACWIAGRAGLLLRTIDGGRTWTRVEFPEAADLVAVRAEGSDAATVSTADGRTFETSDGGRTWMERR